MIKRIEILGICVEDYTVRESLMRFDTYLSSAVLNIIETLTMRQLLLAGENPVIEECLKQADLCIIGDREILSVTGNGSAQRMREIHGRDFLVELLKRVVRSQKRVFLIAMTERELEQAQAFLTGCNQDFAAAGSYAVQACTGALDAVVNEINGLAPDLVISALSSPAEEEFVLAYKDKLGVGLWYGMGSPKDWQQETVQISRMLQKQLLKLRLWLSVSKYQKMEDEDRKSI